MDRHRRRRGGIGRDPGGGFGGHWLSKTDLVVTVRLTAEAVDASVTARNVGKEAEPIAIAWHPYFNLPSGDRTQARVSIPADHIAEVDGYDNVFPTGKLLPVEGTRFDLRGTAGVALGTEFFRRQLEQPDWKDKAATVSIVDPAAHYGVKIEGLSPEIKAIQMYAPPTKLSLWPSSTSTTLAIRLARSGAKDTGMVTLKPGESTKWHVRLKVFVP